MTHDYKLALAPIEYEIEMRKLRGFEQTPLSDKELEVIRKALEIAIALQPKPISETRDVEVLGIDSYGDYYLGGGDAGEKGIWVYGGGRHILQEATHFYDISALPKPEVAE